MNRLQRNPASQRWKMKTQRLQRQYVPRLSKFLSYALPFLVSGGAPAI
jgi:hypothetical protein